jgi:hypothetical protein
MIRVRSLLAGMLLGVASMALGPIGAASAQEFPDDVIRPIEILNYLYENGFSRVRMPKLRGDVYVILATDQRGRRLRLVVDAYDGTLVDRRPIGPDRTTANRRYAEDGVVFGEPVPDSSVQIDQPRQKPKKKKAKVASLPPDPTSTLDAPGAAPDPVPMVEDPKPAPPKPVVTKPIASTPIVPKPVVAKPVVAKPVVAKPVVAKPVVTAPVVTVPVEPRHETKPQPPRIVSLPENHKSPISPLPEPAAPPILKPVLPPATPTVVRADPKPLPVDPARPAPPRLVTPKPEIPKPETVATIPVKPKPRVIPITPPADLDAPPLPKPPPLRGSPTTPVVGLE